MEFHSSVPPIDLSPLKNLTIPQFLLDSTPEVESLGLRPPRDAASATWLVEDETGKRYDLETVRQRVYGLANALAGAWGVQDGDVGELRLLPWC
jgi:4-coumarate--CoA ligase